MSANAEEQTSATPVAEETGRAAAAVEVPDAEEVVEEKSTKICDMITEYLEKESDESKQPLIAFEYYPPRTKEGVQNLYERFTRMEKQKPLYADVTWGAMGVSIKWFFSVVVSLCVSFSANAGLFKISINDLGGLTPSQSSVFDDAIAYWESYLIGVQSEFNHNIVIDASGVALDGVGGVLGSAGPTGITQLPDSTFVYANNGRMRFDTADLDSLESRGTLFDVIVHEMAHVIGFGTLWTTDFFIAGSQSNYTSGSGRYTGEYALEIYRREFVENATFIPVELGGGAGTANSHWDEPWPGGSSDLMTGYLGPYPISLSDTTVASFADIGYLTTVTHVVSEAATVWLFLFSMGLVVRRHHQRSTGASTRRLQIFQAMSV